jgi:high-affinity K+ transport system ATPase subunit B
VQVVPVDGDVYEGKATVTVEHLTGESTPVEKQAGDAIPGGARNLDLRLRFFVKENMNKFFFPKGFHLYHIGRKFKSFRSVLHSIVFLGSNK